MFDECQKSKRYAGRVTEDFEEEQSIGINGMPGNIPVNDGAGEARSKSGAAPYAALKAEISRLLQ